MSNTYEKVVVIGKEEYKSYEDFLHREYIRRELAVAKEQAKDPNTRWLSEEDFWAGIEDGQ